MGMKTEELMQKLIGFYWRLQKLCFFCVNFNDAVNFTLHDNCFTINHLCLLYGPDGAMYLLGSYMVNSSF